MAKIRPKRVLVVEGNEDCRVIPDLMEANGIIWGSKNNPVVNIKVCEGYENLVKWVADPEKMTVRLQESSLVALGILVDADDNPEARWQSIRNASLKSIPDLPKSLSEEGLIHLTANGIRFGIWMMPDNKMRGMLETFLAYMIPDYKPLWELAQAVTQEAKHQGATFKEHHVDKANIYTWLAWQNPPGRQLHQAIQQRILDPNHPQSQNFVAWFKKLYELD